jgi:hypothetical protein
MFLLFPVANQPVIAQTVVTPPPRKIELWMGQTKLRGANIWQKVRTDLDLGGWPSDANKCADHLNDLTETVYTPDDFKKLRSWNANYVNISAPAPYSQKPLGDGPAAGYRPIPCLLAHLQNLVCLAQINGLYSVIGFRTGPGRSEKHFDEHDNSETRKELFAVDRRGRLTKLAQAAQAAWIEAWKNAANAFYGNPAVAGYELMVEPGSDMEKSLKDHPGLWFDLALRAAQAIRTIDSGENATPILIQGLGFGGVDGFVQIPVAQFRDVSNVVFTVHQYQPDRYTHQNPDEGDEDCRNFPGSAVGRTLPIPLTDPVLRLARCQFDRIHDFATGGRPTAVTEFGVFRYAPDAFRFLNAAFDILEAMRVNHAIWLWEINDIGNFDDFSYRRGSDPSNHRPGPENVSSRMPTPEECAEIRRPNALPPPPRPGAPAGDLEINDWLIRAIKCNWAQNTIFAPLQ